MSDKTGPSTSASGSRNEGGRSSDPSSSSTAVAVQEAEANAACCGFTTRKFTSVAYLAFVFTLAGIFLVAAKVNTDKQGLKIDNQGLPVYVYLTIVLVISILWMVSTIASGCYLNWAQRHMPSHVEPKKDLIPTRLLVGVMFFGLGSSFMTMVDFIEYLERHECYIDQNVAMLCYYVVRTVFIYTQLYFFYKLSRRSERFMFYSHFQLMHLIAVNLGTWIVTFIYDSAEELNDDPESSTGDHIRNSTMLFMVRHWDTIINANKTECYKMVETLESTAKKMEPYLYTFTMEYCLISAGLLLNAWLSLHNKDETIDQQGHLNDLSGVKKAVQSGKYRGKQPKGKKQYHKISSSTSQDSDVFPSGIHSYVDVDSDTASESMPEVGTLWRFGFIFGLVYVPAFFAIVFNMIYSDTKRKDHVIYLLTQFVFFVSILIACCIGIRKLESPRSPQESHSNVDFILLGGSLVGVVLLDMLIVLAAICEWSHSPYVCACLLLANITELACSIAFTYFVRKAFEIPGERNDSFNASAPTIREVVSFLFMLNICFWALYTFEVKKSNKILGIVEQFYTKKVWFYLSHFAYPLAVFFHFHGAVCMVEILNIYSVRKSQTMSSTSVSVTVSQVVQA